MLAWGASGGFAAGFTAGTNGFFDGAGGGEPFDLRFDHNELGLLPGADRLTQNSGNILWVAEAESSREKIVKKFTNSLAWVGGA